MRPKTDEQEEIIRQVNQVLKGNKKVFDNHHRLMKKQRPLLTRAAAVLNSSSTTDPNPMVICCTDGQCTVELQSVCVDGGGTCTPLPTTATAARLRPDPRHNGPEVPADGTKTRRARTVPPRTQRKK